jgi:hypothetical protein
LSTLNPEARFVDGAVVGVGSFKPGKQKKPGKFHKARFSFPIQSSNEHPLEGTSPTILLLKNDANDDDLQTKYLFTQH